MDETAPQPASEDIPPDPAEFVAQLLRLLDVEQLDKDLYRGARQPNGRGRVFGGQVIAQALAGAMRSVSGGKVAHSLHAYFMRPGDEDLPILYRVMRDFEGASFATRRVIASQRGEPILNMAASFQRPEPGFSHQDPMPDAPAPETLISNAEARRREGGAQPPRIPRSLRAGNPIEIRSVTPYSLASPEPREPRDRHWFRAAAPVGNDPDVHRAILAYASDMLLLGASMLPHAVNWTTPGMQTASLDHALWFHEPFRVDDWLLYVRDSPWAGHGRGFNRGQIFTRDGRLVASVAQEGLIRMRGR